MLHMYNLKQGLPKPQLRMQRCAMPIPEKEVLVTVSHDQGSVGYGSG